MSQAHHHSSHHHHDIVVPRGALIAAGSLILLTIVVVAAFRIAGMDPTAMVPEPERTVESRTLRFEDSADGTVLIYALDDGSPERLVQVVPSGEGGFIRGILRSLARSRRASGIGREHPFLLQLQPNGSLLLEDPQTETRIDLQAFGPTNLDAFRALLASQETRP